MREIRMSGSVGRGLRPPYPITTRRVTEVAHIHHGPCSPAVLAGTGPQASAAAGSNGLSTPAVPGNAAPLGGVRVLPLAGYSTRS